MYLLQEVIAEPVLPVLTEQLIPNEESPRHFSISLVNNLVQRRIFSGFDFKVIQLHELTWKYIYRYNCVSLFYFASICMHFQPEAMPLSAG